MPTDDLLSPIPLQALSARIPVQDVSLQIQCENRVVLDDFNLDTKQLLALAKTRFDLLTKSYVADKSEDENAFYGLQKTKADFQRELASVLAAADQIKKHTHWPDSRLGEVTRHMLFMNFAESFGNQNGMGPADEVPPGIAEHLPGEFIGKQNDPGAVDDDHPFGKRLQYCAYSDVSLEKPGGESYLLMDS